MNFVLWFRHSVTAFFLAYGLLVAFIWGMYHLDRGRLVLVQQAQHVMHFITLAALLMLIAGVMVFVRKWMLLALLPGALMFLVWYGPSFLPKSEPDVEGREGIEISVATYNVLGGLTDVNAVFPVVEALDADVIAFQEISPALAAKLSGELGEDYRYQFSNHRGLALISRYPFIETSTDPSEDSRYVRAVLDVEGRRVIVYSFHATIPFFIVGRAYDDWYTSAIVQRTVNQVREDVDPVIVLCDCNSTPRTVQYGWLDDVLDEAFEARGWGFGLTFPANGDLADFPLLRIDYVWYSEHLTPLDAAVVHDSGGSDHFPLWARLVLRDS